MSNVYQSVTSKYKGSPTIAVIHILALVMLIIGLNHFIEDTNSSMLGIKSLEDKFKLNAQIFNWTYLTMSLAPQVATMVFGFMYLSDTRRKEYLWGSLLSQLMDFAADTWYRGNGRLLEDPMVFTLSSVLTFIYYSIGSEVFVTIGFGLLLVTTAPALVFWKQVFSSIAAASEGKYPEIKQENQEKGKQNTQPIHKPQVNQEMMNRIKNSGGHHGQDRRQGGGGGRMEDLEAFKRKENGS